MCTYSGPQKHRYLRWRIWGVTNLLVFRSTTDFMACSAGFPLMNLFAAKRRWKSCPHCSPCSTFLTAPYIKFITTFNIANPLNALSTVASINSEVICKDSQVMICNKISVKASDIHNHQTMSFTNIVLLENHYISGEQNSLSIHLLGTRLHNDLILKWAS